MSKPIRGTESEGEQKAKSLSPFLKKMGKTETREKVAKNRAGKKGNDRSLMKRLRQPGKVSSSAFLS